MSDTDRPSDYDQQADTELRQAANKAEQQESRLAEEGSEEALDAERTQREAMNEELPVSSEGMNGAQVRKALAGALAGVARGLSASARMAEQASWMLRPRETVTSQRQSASEDHGQPAPAGTEVGDPGGQTVDPDGAAVDPHGEAVDRVGEAVEPPAAAVEPPGSDVEPHPEPPPTVGAPDGPDRARVAETHIADLAERPVTEVVTEIPNLSTDELGRLYDHEVAHKNRKTVLRAIERASEPP